MLQKKHSAEVIMGEHEYKSCRQIVATCKMQPVWNICSDLAPGKVFMIKPWLTQKVKLPITLFSWLLFTSTKSRSFDSDKLEFGGNLFDSHPLKNSWSSSVQAARCFLKMRGLWGNTNLHYLVYILQSNDSMHFFFNHFLYSASLIHCMDYL